MPIIFVSYLKKKELDYFKQRVPRDIYQNNQILGEYCHKYKVEDIRCWLTIQRAFVIDIFTKRFETHYIHVYLRFNFSHFHAIIMYMKTVCLLVTSILIICLHTFFVIDIWFSLFTFFASFLSFFCYSFELGIAYRTVE